MRLKIRYFFFPVLVALFIGLIFLTYTAVKEKTISEFNHHQLTLARQAAHGIESFFNRYRNELSFLPAWSPSLTCRKTVSK